MSQTNYSFGNSFISFNRVTLAPGARQPVSVQGQFFRCGEVTSNTGQNFSMSFKGDEFFPMNQGLGFRLKGDDYFTKLRFHNPTTEDMVIEFWAGAGEVDDSRLNIVRGRSAPVSIAETIITGGEMSIEPDAYLDITDDLEVGEGDDFQKRSDKHKLARVIVTNLDPAVDITLCNMSSGGAFGSVFPRQALVVDSSEGCRILNESAAPVLVRVAIVWWKFDI